MATGQLNLVVNHIRRLIRGPGDVTDVELLERFTYQQDGAAFAALVERHGPMVFGLCRRVLNQEQDAEDAFQATFLVLALRARSIRKLGSLGSWLYGVASRLALKMKAQAARRRFHERRAVPMSSQAANGEQDWTELRPLLDEELQHLPEKYRAPLVLCYLEGKTNADAARELGCALGSMSKRLSRGRELLRARLVRRGVSLSLPVLGTLLTEKTRAAVTAALLETSVQVALRVAAREATTGIVSATVAGLAKGVTRKMFFTKFKVAIALLIGLALAVGGGLAAHSWTAKSADDDPPQQVARAASQVELPADLGLVPEDAMGFVRVAVQDLYESDVFKAVRRSTGTPLPGALEGFEKSTGLALADLRFALVIMFPSADATAAAHGAAEPVAVLTTTRPYARKRIQQAIAPDAKEQQAQGKIYFMSKDGEAVSFINDRTFVLGRGANLKHYLAQPTPASLQGPLGPGLKLAARGHTLVAGFRVPEALAQEIHKHPLPAPYAFVKSLLAVESGSLVVDLNGDLEGKLRVQFPDETVARQAHEAAKTGLYILRQQLAAGLPEEWLKERLVAQGLKEAELVLKTARLTQDGKTLQLSMETNASRLMALLLPAAAQVRTASSRMQNENNLKQITLAMHNYADGDNRFPPAAITDKNGRPLLSWRVAILPYLEQDALYRQFKLDEPWDSPHNRRLLARMPATYALPGLRTAKPGETYYQVFTGKGTVFDSEAARPAVDPSEVPTGQRNKGVRFADITDGMSNTLLAVEAADPVPWTKPADLPFDPTQPLPRLGGHFGAGFDAAFCDGNVRFIKSTIDSALLRALITRNGGELIEPGKIP